MTAFAPTSPFATTKAQVKLGEGQSLHFQPGKGYFAGPAPAARAATDQGFTPQAASVLTPSMLGAITPLTQQQIAADAANTAAGQVGAQVAPVLSAQQNTNAADLAAQREAASFDVAGSKLLGSIGPQAQAGFTQAAGEQAGLAGAFTGQAKDDITAQQAKDAEMARNLGVTGANVPQGVDPSAFGNALYDTSGFIPSSNLLAQGALARQAAAGEVGVNQDTARAEQQGLRSQQTSDNSKAAQQIATIAAKYPQYFTAQEHADIQNNLTKVTQGVSAFKAATSAENDVVNQGLKQQALEISSQNSQLKAIVAQNQAEYQKATLAQRTAYENATIKIRGYQAQLAFQKLKQTGATIDKSASMVSGVVVLKDGSIARDKKGNPIPIDPRVYGSGSKTNTPQALYQKAVAAATKALGTPVVLPANSPASFHFKYILDPGLNPKTGERQGALTGTNDPARAEKSASSTFSQMQQTIMGEFSLSKAQARKALVQAGWKPAAQPKTTKVTDPFAIPGTS